MKTPANLLILLLLCSCAATKNYNPAKKYSPEELRQDYQLFRNILEESHPSLYWYTSRDSMDYYFEQGENKISDSMQEYRFRNLLSEVLSKIHCGHTTVRASKGASNYAGRTRSISFPLNIKAWQDTVVLTSSLNRRDSFLKRGTIIKSIEGRPVQQIVDSFFHYLSHDGYNLTHKYQTISNTGVFRTMYGTIYGIRPRMNLEYIDTAGNLRSATISVYNPSADTPARQAPRPPQPQLSRHERKQLLLRSQRSFRIDTALNTGFLEVNTFMKKYRLRSFFRQSFREMQKKQVPNLVVDMRGNGGGNVTLSNLLTRYIADAPFKIADSLYAIRNKSRYHQYQNNYFLNRLFFIFMTRKQKDGHYHFRLFEGKYFKPKSAHHFEGTTYILTGGNTFSAASLFTKALVAQQDVIVVGEETGGGAYGNTAWLIPDVTLPHTGVRFRLPLFRLVIDRDAPKGRGIIPEVQAGPTVEAIKKNADYKMDTVIRMIKNRLNPH